MEQRLCHIVKRDHFDGYGFDLHAEKGKPGQYIGKVDDGSPAQAAGLRQGDRIVEVNGASIEGKVHRDVVDLIKAVAGETRLLVVSEDASASKHNNDANGTTTNGTSSTRSVSNGSELSDKSLKSDGPSDHHSQETLNAADATNGAHSLNLNMTAAELRARLAAKKKFDPKKETTLDFRKKFDIVQKM